MMLPGPLESRAAITDLIHRYARNVRDRTPAASADLFVDDVSFEVRELDFADPSAPSRRRSIEMGKAAVLAHIGRSADGAVRVCPTITNVLIDIDGDAARANCLMTSRVWPSGQTLFGQYDDDFIYDGDRWRFRSRVYTIFGDAS